MRKNFKFSAVKRIVIKVGTSVLTDAEGSFSMGVLERIVLQVKELLESRRQIVLVSSGAIGCGMKLLRLKKRPRELPLLQACAAVGQGKLMKAYEELFSTSGYHAAQVLLTREAFQDRVRCLNMKNTFESLLKLGVVPIVNENDTVSTEEIRFGDNDTLSVSVAELVAADLLILLSDVDGFHVDGGRSQYLEEVASVQEVDDLFKHIYTIEKKVVTRGGMASKLEVAKRAMKSGIAAVVMNGKEKEALSKLFRHEPIGTFFFPADTKQGFKKNWLANLTIAHGTIRVDDGAHRAIVEGGKSLLPSGVRHVDGNFKAGDSVRLMADGGEVFARGIVNYSSEELRKIMGKKSHEIESILGFRREDEVVHRDNLVVTE